MSTTETKDAVTEVKEWLAANWDPDLTVAEWWERLGASGWAAPALPEAKQKETEDPRLKRLLIRAVQRGSTPRVILLRPQASTRAVRRWLASSQMLFTHSTLWSNSS